MQVLFPKHVWRHTECMPTSHWRTGASHISLCVITVAWWISSKQITDPLPTSLSHCCCYLFCSAAVTTVAATVTWFVLLLLSLLLLATVATCYCCHYCCSLPLLLLVTLPLLATLLLLLCLQILIFQVWLNLTNSAANTWEHTLTSCLAINKFGSNTLPSKTVANPRAGGPSTTFF